MKRLSLLYLIFVSCLVTNDLSAQTEVIAPVGKDNSLFESDGGSLSNGAGTYLFAGKTSNGEIRRGLVMFDVSSVPQGSRVESVTLTLHMSKTISGAEDVALHSLLADWGEGSSDADFQEGKGIDPKDGDATWIHRFWDTKDTWVTPGGDYSPTASATLAVNKTGSYTWGSTEQLVADVQSWVDNPESNYGWIFIGNESSNGSAKRFDSKENTSEMNRPVLTVTYLTVVSVEDTNAGVPGNYELAQNSPNPFNPSTTIGYSIPNGVSGNVTLKVFDLRGAVVTTLVNQAGKPGMYSAVWDGTDTFGNSVSSGVYIYTIQAGEFTKSNKMMLMR